jgi:hypothetical protein
MAALGVNKSIARNRPIKLNDALVTGTGTLDFDCPSNTGDFSALFQAVGTLTTLVCDLQFSLDNGVTFNVLVANLLVAATPFKLQTPIVGGARYRLNITTASGSQDFWVTRN